MKLQFKFLLFFSCCLLLGVSSCVKDNVTSDLKIVESVAIAETLDFQTETLLESIANHWDNQILPFGVKRVYSDTNASHSKFKIDFGKMQLCGDYISRTGTFNVELFTSNGQWDSLYCNIISGDSFGVQTDFGTIYLYGTFKLRKKEVLQVNEESEFSIYLKNSWSFKYSSNALISRLKKNPTSIDFHDGNLIYGQCSLAKDNSNFKVLAEIIGVTKPVDAPNFPIAGELNCNLISGENVQVYYDPYTNLNFDKVAKARSGDSEWFFNFQ